MGESGRKNFKGAIVDSIMIGYFPVASYGLLAKNTGLVLGDNLLILLVELAPALRVFMCVNL